jgi:hypothetical protein
MLEQIADAAFSSAVINVALLTSWDVLPALLLAYTFQSLAARRVRAEFWLRKSEAVELDRALLLYKNVTGQLKAIDQSARQPSRSWRAIFALQASTDPLDADQRDELESYARRLRATIAQLRRLPLERLRGFVRVMSLRFALGCAVVVHVTGSALFFLMFRPSEHAASVHELTRTTGDALIALVWYPLDQSLFQGNAVGACFAALSVPLLYVLRWTRLHQEFGLEFCVLNELAATGPDQSIDQPGADPIAELSDVFDWAEHKADEWFTILGVAPSATRDQVREAYKMRIKQSHPDRVQDMSPAIRKFAEAETKKLNAAYQQALTSVS